MLEQKKRCAGDNRSSFDVVFRVWFILGNHKAFKCRSEDEVLSSIKQPEADGETQTNPENYMTGWDIKDTSVVGSTFQETTEVIWYLFKSPWYFYFILSSSDAMLTWVAILRTRNRNERNWQ